MKNNWIRHLAADIAERFNRPQAERMLEDVIREAVRENMPDAESLAVALEGAVETIKAWHGIQEGDATWNIYFNHSPEMKSIRAVLATHRAAHPAQVSTEVVLGNK